MKHMDSNKLNIAKQSPKRWVRKFRRVARRTAPGFTLIETILVIALFAFTVILASNIFINNQRAQIAAGSYDRLVADTRTALDSLSQAVRTSTVDYSAYQDPNRDGSPGDSVSLGTPTNVLRLRDLQGQLTLFGLAADGTVSTCTIDPSQGVQDSANKCDAVPGGSNWNPVTSNATKFTTLTFSIVPGSNALQYAPERAADCRTTSAFQGATGICSCTVDGDCLPDQECVVISSITKACRLNPAVDSLQPRVTILMNGQTLKGQTLKHPVETTVVSRVYLR